jgi:hypothetical protein
MRIKDEVADILRKTGATRVLLGKYARTAAIAAFNRWSSRSIFAVLPGCMLQIHIPPMA